MQGVTSIVTGNCGHGIAPVTAHSRKLVSMNIAGWRRESAVPITWESFGHARSATAQGVAAQSAAARSADPQSGKQVPA